MLKRSLFSAIASAALVFTAVLASSLTAPQPAHAQAWPQRPVTLVVPYASGTGIDIIARTLSPKLAERLGQGFVVENKPGASGNIGANSSLPSMAVAGTEST